MNKIDGHFIFTRLPFPIEYSYRMYTIVELTPNTNPSFLWTSVGRGLKSKNFWNWLIMTFRR